MSKHTNRTYAALHESRRGLDHVLTMLVVEGMLDPRDGDRLFEAIGRLNEAWSAYAHTLGADL